MGNLSNSRLTIKSENDLIKSVSDLQSSQRLRNKNTSINVQEDEHKKNPESIESIESLSPSQESDQDDEDEEEESEN